MRQFDDTIQNILLAAAELRYLAYDEPSCHSEYLALADTLEEIGETIDINRKIRASQVAGKHGNMPLEAPASGVAGA